MPSYNNHIFTRHFLDFIRVPQGCYKVGRAESTSHFTGVKTEVQVHMRDTLRHEGQEPALPCGPDPHASPSPSSSTFRRHTWQIPQPRRRVLACVLSRFTRSDSLQPYGLWPIRLLSPWDSPGKNTGVGCHTLLQGIFLTQRITQLPPRPHTPPSHPTSQM